MPDHDQVPPNGARVVADRYQLTERIGRGGMADVWEAIDLRLGRPVALKVLSSEMTSRPELRTRFQIEARAAAGLSHPGAVSVYDTGEFAGRPYLVMERLPGDTLRDRIAQGPVDPVWLRASLVELLGALSEAHKAGIVHRDVKPGNILITASGTTKLADFGIAKSLHDDTGEAADLTDTGHLMGTPAYLAPERIDGHPATPQSDIYSLGVVAYEALTGEKPFKGDGALAVALAVARGQHRKLGEVKPDLDPGLVSVIERAMASEPASRFPTAAAMREALAESPGAPSPIDTTVPLSVGRSVEGEPERTSTLSLPAAGLARDPAPAGPQEATPDGDSVGGAGSRRRWVTILALVALAGGVVWLASYAASQSRSGTVTPPSSSTAPSTVPATTTTSPTTTTTAPTTTTVPVFDLEGFLRDLADSLSGETAGRRARNLSVELDRVAGLLGTPVQGRFADNAMEKVADWLADGDISYSAADESLRLLSLVPGAGPPPTTVIPANAFP